MYGIFMGIVLSLLMCIIIVFISLWIQESYYNYENQIRGVEKFLCVAVMIIVITLSIKYDRDMCTIWLNQYSIQKEVIESSISNNKLGGFERVELIRQANELNAELVKKQYECMRWYGFNINKKVLHLEPILFE